MLISLFIIFPLVLKLKDTFYYIIAPLGALLCFGFLYYKTGTLSDNQLWMGFIFKGNIRAIGGILAGCVCFKLSNFLFQVKLTNLSKWILTLIEFLLYFSTIVLTFRRGFDKIDYILLVFLLIATCITLSNNSHSTKLFNNKVIYWLGEYSFSLYLSHAFWKNLPFPDSFNYPLKLSIYVLISFACALCVMYISKMIRHMWKKNKLQISRIFIKND